MQVFWGLDKKLAQLYPWVDESKEIVHMFCDAAGNPAHLGVVIFFPSMCYWTHADPPEGSLAWFTRRGDNQIMGLELMAISLGLSTFGHMLKGCKVIVHCDNKGAEVTL